MLTLTYSIYQYDVEHQLKEKQENVPSLSFTKQMLDFIYGKNSLVELTSTDITNASRSLTYSQGTANLKLSHVGLDSHMVNVSDGFRASDEVGIVVGTGNTAVTPIDFKLVTQVAHGTGSGQLEHYGCWTTNYQVNSGTQSCTFDIERIFRNGSGGNITLNEMGIYYVMGQFGHSSSTLWSFCIVRDVLGTASGTTTVTVNDGEYLKIKYTFKIIV